MVGRPKGSTKYKTVQQRKAALVPVIKSKYFRLVIPNLKDYIDSNLLKTLKGDTLNLILQKQNPYGLQYYKIASQTHPTTGIPHFDILLLYKSSLRRSLNRYDYLVKHGNLTRYKKLNEAILSYGDKQDKNVLTNMPIQLDLILKSRDIQEDSYKILQKQMFKNPFHFNAYSWLNQNKLTHSISKTNWSKTISLLTKIQEVQCNKILSQRPGFKFISQSHIQSILSPSELKTFYSWDGYQTIINYLNQVPLYGNKRPFKTKNLLLVGPSHIGKTSLISEPNHNRSNPSIQELTSTYHMGMKHWFPKYKSGTYKLIFWNQFKLTSYSYDVLLKFFEGSPVDLPYHGGSTMKEDNPLIYMTSNMSLEQHICHKFMANRDRQLARENLSCRITEVLIPQTVDLFLLRKLLIWKSDN